MIDNEEQVRAAIAEQAGEWFVANDGGSLDAQSSKALADWLKTSPVHVAEFLGVSVVARDLREIGADPEYSVEAVLAHARTEEDHPSIQRFRHHPPIRRVSSHRWLAAAMTTAASAVLGLGLLWLWSVGPKVQAPAPPVTTALHFATRHGEQQTRQLADHSVLHLNTDSAVTVRYSKTERLVALTSGEVLFEVAHEPKRSFRVQAGSADVVDIGTKFNVRLQQHATVVTVLEGRVAAGSSSISAARKPGTNPGLPAEFVTLGVGQQISIDENRSLAAPVAVDAERTTAWLHRQIQFEHEPLERVAAEFNRYTPKPIEIVTPALQHLEISGVFATDDTEAFIAFLRSLEGVRVEVTAGRIRVSGD
jgi:transmembrane sensor